MARDNKMSFRCDDELKIQIEALARKENRTVSSYIENLLAIKIKEDNANKNKPLN